MGHVDLGRSGIRDTTSMTPMLSWVPLSMLPGASREPVKFGNVYPIAVFSPIHLFWVADSIGLT